MILRTNIIRLSLEGTEDMLILGPFKVPTLEGSWSKISMQILEFLIGKDEVRERSRRMPTKILRRFSNASFAMGKFKMLFSVLLAPNFVAETASRSG